MGVRVTSTDLDDWSRRKDSEAHLPTLVRRLIMATSRPAYIRMPAAEGVALAGLDGVVSVNGGAAPYVPSGDSMWELGTNAGKRAKAIEDYEKRTQGTLAAERAKTTYVCVLSRRWGSGQKWIDDMKARGEGWKDIQVLAADELALWMEDCPGVEAWFREHHGLSSLGDIGIGDWFVRWAKQTDPHTPAAVLTAGRRQDVIRVLDALEAAPADVPVAASSVEEAVAFVAAALFLGPSEDPDARNEYGEALESAAADSDVSESGEKLTTDLAIRRPETLEALRERTIVIQDLDGWRRWSRHATPHILVPLFLPDSIPDAIDAGHHVVVPQRSRAGQQDGRLRSIDPHAAATAWQESGIDFSKAQDYAFGSRRNLGSLRRRLSRYGKQVPLWAESQDASLLASVLLVGGWNGSAPGDRELLVSLAEHNSWRALSKTLMPLTIGDDPPLSVLEDRWGFVDVIDAWDTLLPLVTADDLSVFADAILKVLPEQDPELGMTGEERFKLLFDENRPRRRYSRALRRGMATTLAILGCLVGRETVPGNQTGQSVATIAVRKLLDGADEIRWLTLVDVLQQLAEAAPVAFLDALESSLRQDQPTVMRLFVETKSMLGDANSSHASLLWALETLAFSPVLVSRVCVVLARLAVLDPGGRWDNRPASSLASVLGLIHPRGAINASNRIDVLDAVIAAVPEHASTLLKMLAEDRGGGIIPLGPRYRSWPVPRGYSTHAELANSLTEVCTRLLEGAAAGLPEAAGLIGRFSVTDLVRVTDTLTARWNELDDAERDQVIKSLNSVVKKHRRYNAAAWAMSPADLAVVEQFLADHGVDLDTAKNARMFTFTSEVDDEFDVELSTSGEAVKNGHIGSAEATTFKTLDVLRRDAVLELLAAGGLDQVVNFASHVEVPSYVGRAVADATTKVDDEVLDLLGDGSNDPSTPSAGFAWGFAVRRTENLGWLESQIAARPSQAAQLLLTARIEVQTLEFLDTFDSEQRQNYWLRANPYQSNPDLVERVCNGFLEVDRPFSAIITASVCDEPGPTPDLIIRVLSAPMAGTQEKPIPGMHSFEYAIGRLLNKLEKLGTPDEVLARLECFYLPILDHHREPRAAHRELARKPELFAEAVAHCYKPDREPDNGIAAVGGEEKSLTSKEYRFSDVYFRLLHSWNGPLPGADGDKPPTAEALQAWIDQARVELGKLDRAGVASGVIGETLAAPTVDPDGTWPCEAVRVVLEREQDGSLEDHLAIRRFNQGGAASRSIYAGGGKERKLAEGYRVGAAKVTHRWPRAGALLEGIASTYDHDARREDGRAERDARGGD